MLVCRVRLGMNATLATLRIAIIALALAVTGYDRCLASPFKQLDSVDVLWEHQGKIESKTIPYKDAPTHTSLRIVHPDRAANPEKKLETWSGPKVSDLLKTTGLKPKPGTTLSLIATDNYVGSLDIEDALEHQATIALDRNGQTMPSSAGGPHVVYEISKPGFPHWLTLPGYWVWLVVKIVVGELPALVELSTPSGTRQLDFTRLRNGTKPQSIKRFLPVGERKGGVPDTVTVSATTLALTDVVREMANECQGRNIKAESLTGTTLEIKPDALSTLDFVLAWEGKAIPVRFGGPIQLCDLKGPRGCVYFLRRLGCT